MAFCIPTTDDELSHDSSVQAIKPRRAPQQQVSIRLPQPQIEELDRIARSAGCLRSDLVRQALRLGLITLTALDEQETNQ